MSRYEQVIKQTNGNLERVGIGSSENREKMTIALLAQISETFALYLDIYAATHGVHYETSDKPDVSDEDKKKLRKAYLKKVAEERKKEDSERIPDSEIPFASDE